jgi:hypothetical protein
MWIETVMHMSGTRANGDKYPPGFTPFEVADWEGEHLIRGGMARAVATPEWAVPKPPAPLPEKPVTVPGPVMQEPDPAPPAYQPDDPEPELAAPAGLPPAPGDPKQAWVDYAVTQGMPADDASRMTKADLQSRFGPRL